VSRGASVRRGALLGASPLAEGLDDVPVGGPFAWPQGEGGGHPHNPALKNDHLVTPPASLVPRLPRQTAAGSLKHTHARARDALGAWARLFWLFWLVALALTLALGLALALRAAWERRLALVPLAARYFGKVSRSQICLGKVELGLEDLRVSWVLADDPLGRLAALDAPFDSLSVTLLACSVATPFGDASDRFVHCKSVVVRLLKQPTSPRRFDAHVLVDGMDARFVAYNSSFSDTNVQRLADTLAGPSQPKAQLSAEPAPAVAADAQAAQVQDAGPVVLRTVRIADASIAVQLNLGKSSEDARQVLPLYLLLILLGRERLCNNS
jgi:hypothetical protein